MKKAIQLIILAIAAICAINAPALAAELRENTSPAAVETVQPNEQKTPDKEHSSNKKKKSKLDVNALVRDNVISKETGDKIKVYLKEHKKERKEEFEKIKKLSEEERKAYFDKKKEEGKLGLWNELVAVGVITQEEADAICAARKDCPRGRECEPGAAGSGSNSEAPNGSPGPVQ
ncbi:MAG: hypothetical protein LBL96_07945 [Clostridiales bacterium]|jgi:hypothetical protein|nr:hypothetical protein [Clostridiales bacterium]